ncbi:PilZ domain-containing protein [Phenylobacterium sp. LjRoot164]|uniref:PilZ domain-containing protein n=1 Tax=unclassified Phenylobacterium TaxID=2640670 RepID=UPI003ECF7C56
MTPPDATPPITERWSRASGGIERRATPREPVLLPALLVEADGRRRPCVILDRSEGGLRLNLPGDEPAPDAFCVLDLVTGMGREVHVAWRKPPELGVRTVRTYDLDQPQEGLGEVLRQIRISVLG